MTEQQQSIGRVATPDEVLAAHRALDQDETVVQAVCRIAAEKLAAMPAIANALAGIAGARWPFPQR